MKKSEVCLVLTGCVAPPNDVYMLAIKDCSIREKQYMDALEFYIKKINIKKIVFCDNSNFREIPQIRKMALEYGKDLEWLCFKGNAKKTAEKGKGYGEGEILKYVCENSKTIQTCKYMVKVTGRLKISNLNFILRIICDDQNYMNVYIDKQKECFADTRCFIMKTEEFRRYFIDEYEKVNDRGGEYLELCIARKLMKSDVQYKGFPVYIGYEGVSGSTGLIYKLSVREKTKISMKLLMAKLLRRGEKCRPMELYSIGVALDRDIWANIFSKFLNKRIAVYGAGILGKRWYQACARYCDVVVWVDRDYQQIKKVFRRKIRSPKDLRLYAADYIVVAIASRGAFMGIRKYLRDLNIQAPIVWYNGYSVSDMNGKDENESE